MTTSTHPLEGLANWLAHYNSNATPTTIRGLLDYVFQSEYKPALSNWRQLQEELSRLPVKAGRRRRLLSHCTPEQMEQWHVLKERRSVLQNELRLLKRLMRALNFWLEDYKRDREFAVQNAAELLLAHALRIPEFWLQMSSKERASLSPLIRLRFQNGCKEFTLSQEVLARSILAKFPALFAPVSVFEEPAPETIKVAAEQKKVLKDRLYRRITRSRMRLSDAEKSLLAEVFDKKTRRV